MSEMDFNVGGNFEVGGDLIGGDKVGRDKIVNVQNIYYTETETHIPRMAPAAPTQLVGRDQLLMELTYHLQLERDNAAHESPVVMILSGMGGVGKTALAAYLANDNWLTQALPDGVLWAQLGQQSDGMTWLDTWGDQLGFDLSSYNSIEARARTLGTLLHEKEMLIVIDDVWDFEDVQALIIGGGGCRVIITTRDGSLSHQLGEQSSRLFRVPPLDTDSGLEVLTALAPAAVKADPRRSRLLIEQLGGLPMGITLAGQMIAREWQAGLGVAGALDELTQKASGNRRGGEEGSVSSSLWAMFEVSYQHLPDDESRRAFRHLGVYGGKPREFSVAAAANLWETERRPAQKLLAELVEQQMVEPLGDGRFTMHVSFADYALALLDRHGESDAVHHRHAHYYLELARQHSQQEWMKLVPELDQIRSAYRTLAEQEAFQQVIQYLQVMNPFFTRRGLWNDIQKWTQMALQIVSVAENKPLAGQLLSNLGLIYYQQANWEKALSCYRHSRQIMEEIGDQRGLAITLCNIGAIYQSANLTDDALDYYERSQEIFEAVGDWPRLASVLNDIGTLYRRLDDPEAALDYHQLARKIYEGLDDQVGLARTINQIGAVYDSNGDLAQAMAYYRRGVGLFEENGDLIGEGVALFNIALIHESQGNFDQAVVAMERVVEIDELLNRPDLLADRDILERLKAEAGSQG